MNVFELANALRSMPDQQLVQLAQMHQNDAAVMAAVMNEKANRDKLRASASAAPAPQGQQPTVREQMLAGLGNIPTEGMASMADGGIVSFAGGGTSSTPTLDEIRQYQAEQRALEQAKQRERSGSDTTNWLGSIKAVFDALSGTAQAATPPQPVATSSPPAAPANSSSKPKPLASEDIALLGRLYGTQPTGPEFIKKIVNAFTNRAAGKKLTAEDNAFIEVFNTAKAYETAAAKQAKAEAEVAVTKGSTPVTNASLSPTGTPGSTAAAGLAAAAGTRAKPSGASARSVEDTPTFVVPGGSPPDSFAGGLAGSAQNVAKSPTFEEESKDSGIKTKPSGASVANDELDWQKYQFLKRLKDNGTPNIEPPTFNQIAAAKRRGKLDPYMHKWYQDSQKVGVADFVESLVSSGRDFISGLTSSTGYSSAPGFLSGADVAAAGANPAAAPAPSPAGGAPVPAAETKPAEPAPAAPAPATDAAAKARVRETGESKEKETPSAASLDLEKFFEDKYGKLRQQLKTEQTARETALTARQADMRKQLPDEATYGQDLYADRMAKLTAEGRDDAHSKNLAWADALIAMGAAMMSSKSPTFFGGLGEGVKAGSEEYARVVDRLASRETRRQDLQMKIEEARSQIKFATAKERRDFDRQSAVELQQLRLENAKDLAAFNRLPIAANLELMASMDKDRRKHEYEMIEIEARGEAEARARQAGARSAVSANPTLEKQKRQIAVINAEIARLQKDMAAAFTPAQKDPIRKQIEEKELERRSLLDMMARGFTIEGSRDAE